MPGALRVQRSVDQGQLVVEALLGPREPLEIRWKPQVQLTDAKLVLSSQANTVVDVRAGLLQVDALLDFQVAQGKIEILTFNVPEGLSITAVQGHAIRTWSVGEAADGVRPLRVELSRAQDKEYRLRIQAEAALDRLPCAVEVPVHRADRRHPRQRSPGRGDQQCPAGGGAGVVRPDPDRCRRLPPGPGGGRPGPAHTPRQGLLLHPRRQPVSPPPLGGRHRAHL